MPRLSSIQHIAGFVGMLACLCGSTHACGETAAADTFYIDTTAVQTVAPPVRQLTDDEWAAVNLGRAVDLWLRYDLRGAVTRLEHIDITPTSTFPEADRAAFLLAVTYLRLGDVAAFHTVAERAIDGSTTSPYRDWIRYAHLAHAHDADAPSTTPDLPGAEIFAAALLIEKGRPDGALALLQSTSADGPLATVHLYLQAVAREATGDGATDEWQKLADRRPSARLDADLVATALLRLASERMEKGDDGAALLRRVPSESRHAARATHVLALLAQEAGDTDNARALLQRVLDDHTIYEGRRDVLLALGSLAMDEGDWNAAFEQFESAEADWLYEYESLVHFENDEVLDEIWHAWSQPTLWRDEIRLAPEALLADLVRTATASLDLTRRRDPEPDGDLAAQLWPRATNPVESAAWDRTDALRSYYPLAAEWQALRSLQWTRERTESELLRQGRVVSDMQHDIERRIEYLHGGYHGAEASAEMLAEAAARLGAIVGVLDAAVLQLDAVRDSVLLDIATRTRRMTDGVRRDLLFIRAVRHFHVDGPQRSQPEQFPDGVPSPAELLSMEETLGEAAEDYVTFFAQHYPGVINRSFDEIWEPRLTGDSRGLYGAILAELERARNIGASIDDEMKRYAADPELAAAMTRRDSLVAAVDALAVQETELRRQIAHAVARRGRARLKGQREAIDYHLADAAYELAVRVATNPATAEDDTLTGPPRARAMERLDAFLSRYPQSVARGESRYRLADMRLMQARNDFQRNMASFLGEEPSADDLDNRSLAPFVHYAPAIALYEAILTEDPDFPHMDAVLFNLGMILSDDGQSSAATYLARLVEEYPDSPDCQEAWLRMGNDRFDREDFAGSIAYFEHAVAGDDPSFSAMALYKLGWAYFEGDRFDESTDAFRRLMDHYGAHDDLARDMDLRDEAEEYLVHSLARSGGANAFRDYFDSLGGREYETGILISLGHLLRSVSLFEEAAECDKLWLERYPEHPKTLAVAERLVDTYRSWNKADEARATKLEQAARFLPGGSWYEANHDPAMRASAEAFARSAYRENAAYYHREARRTDDVASWQAALANYDHYLSNWPQVSDSHHIHFMAGDAANRLDDYESSIHHFEVAAESDSLPLALDALWQRVAVADSWYRSTQPEPDQNGADSLAAKLLNTGYDFIDRAADDERCADIVWRQGNVAYAHEWYSAAAASFLLMTKRYPNDPRAPLAVRMGGDAHYRHGEFDAAGAAYEKALEMAVAAGQDSLVTFFRTTIPLCYYKHAESVAEADGEHGEADAAPLFAGVADRWPAFEHADLALYRAGLGYASRGLYTEAAGAWERLLANHGDSEYARDSAIQIALTHEKSGDKVAAARAYERFSRLNVEDPDAPEALLKAADLLSAADDDVGADKMRTLFVERFPGEVDAVMDIRAARATRELERVAAGSVTLGSLLAATATGGAVASDLQAYLDLAAQNPELATPAILAQVDYLKAEEAYPSYSGMRLTQPLPKAIETKKDKMEALLALYDRCAQHGVTEYARASAYRIGQVLIEFGDALIASERPSGLSEDDLLAYDEVLEEQSWQFYDRGTDVWSELLQQTVRSEDDPGGWISRTQQALWPRLAHRFLYRPEVEYPLVSAKPPAKTKAQ